MGKIYLKTFGICFRLFNVDSTVRSCLIVGHGMNTKLGLEL